MTIIEQIEVAVGKFMANLVLRRLLSPLLRTLR